MQCWPSVFFRVFILLLKIVHSICCCFLPEKSRKGESRVKSYSEFLHDAWSTAITEATKDWCDGLVACPHSPAPHHIAYMSLASVRSQDGLVLSRWRASEQLAARYRSSSRSLFLWITFILWYIYVVDSLMGFWSVLLVMGLLIRLLLYVQIYSPASWELK